MLAVKIWNITKSVVMIENYLKELNISYELLEHEAVFTVAQATNLKNKIVGSGCKNLFLKSDTSAYYIYILPDNIKADIKALEKFLNIKKLHFASILELEKILSLHQGGVTPLGIINDRDNKVKIVIDKDLVGMKILVHPNVNIKTISINFDDLIMFIKYKNHDYILM